MVFLAAFLKLKLMLDASGMYDKIEWAGIPRSHNFCNQTLDTPNSLVMNSMFIVLRNHDESCLPASNCTSAHTPGSSSSFGLMPVTVPKP